jgi:hypothetical protein
VNAFAGIVPLRFGAINIARGAADSPMRFLVSTAVYVHVNLMRAKAEKEQVRPNR